MPHLPTTSRRRPGFTLLELMAIVTVVGLLAAIGISKYGQVKRRVAISSMKSDLHNLTSMAEVYYLSNGSYDGFVPVHSANVTIQFDGGADGWIATASHAEASGITCTVGTKAGASASPLCN